MASDAAILRLSNELLREILDQIEADPDKLVSLDRRAYLSQESFRLPPPPSLDQALDIGHFRLVCTRFAELGAIHQFARVTTRFSRHGLRRLEKIATERHLAKHVKKFSYMVPYFYVEGRESVPELLLGRQENFEDVDARNFVRKITEQKEIVRSGEDLRILKKALSAFTSLQHVQILRVQDREDSILLSYIRRHQDTAQQLVELKWAPACSHSTRTLGAALLDSHSPCSRFSSPMLSPQSAEILAAHSPTSFDTLAHRLTSLELHFDDGADLDIKMTELSGVFGNVFKAATNMQALHIGFPSHRPLSLPLESIFHHVKWERLAAFGIQAWKLDADEILGLVRRHRDKLRGLRLRDVLLKNDSSWKDVLVALRNDMPRLDWVSLRRIGYARHFDEQWAQAGVEVPDDPPGGASESDDETDSDSSLSRSDPYPPGGYVGDGESSNDSLSEDEQDSDDSDDDEHGPYAHSMDFPHMASASPDTPSSAPWCNCGSGVPPDMADDLGDNGTFVSNMQRKLWEKWVMRRCFEHPKR